MAKIAKPISKTAPLAWKHLKDRVKERKITLDDLKELEAWVQKDKDVADGDWFIRFNNFILVGHGSVVKSSLEPYMIPFGIEIFK